MVLYFNNTCNSNATVNINDVSFILTPHTQKSFMCSNETNINIIVCPQKQSTVKGDVYNLILQSNYIFQNVTRDIEFFITREKIRVSLNVSYERLFLNSPNVNFVIEETCVTDEKRIKKKYANSKIIELVYGPLEYYPSLSILFLIAGIILACLIDWKLIFLFYPCAYAFLFVLNLFGNIIWKTFVKKKLKMDEQKEFYRHFELDYISQYYSQTHRTPFMGKIDRD